MARAVAALLRAADVPLNTDPELRGTPERVAHAWLGHFLDGYGVETSAALGPRIPAGKHPGLVVVKALTYHSMCPHHLLPVRGVAHLAYLPGRWLAGLGGLVKVLDAFAHRLVLQEQLASDVAQALADGLSSPATACILDATHDCLSLRGPRQRGARVQVAAYTGQLRRAGSLRRELQQLLEQKP
ncbi:MAG: GTP cyclohydrolase I [Myxococcaceae bacterium]